jgi:YVTN family beta-propeller protein
VDARHVGAGSARLNERAPGGRNPQWGPVRRVAHALRTLGRVALLTLLLALACAAPAAASDVYVTNTGSDNVSQYDVGAGGALAPKATPTVAAGDIPLRVAVSPDGQSVYVANTNSNDVSQYDVGAGGALVPKATPTVAAGGVPREVAVSPDGQSVYVANGESGNVSQYDVGAGGALAPKSTATVPAGDSPFGVAVSPDGQSVYVANQGSDNVSQYDVGAGGALAPKSTATVPAGDNPTPVAVSPDGQSVYVANELSNNVSQYDVGASGALAPKATPTVAAGVIPVGVAVRPTPPPPQPNANAGPDQTVDSGDMVQLDGTGSFDPSGQPLTYLWTQTSGPEVTLSGANTATPTFTAPIVAAATTLEFQLEVCDPDAMCDTDSVTITVNPPPPLIDATGMVLLNGQVTSAKTSKSFIFKVSNVGLVPITLNPATDITSSVDVNGTPTGSVSSNSGTKAITAGASTRVKLVWSYSAGDLAAGDVVAFHACANVAGDIDPTNDCNNATAIAN